jgi:uncharacterized membrane protein SirB2
MLEFYPQIKAAHIALVLASGGLFAVRGLLLLLGQQWARAAVVRYLSYTIDSALLTAALMLLVVLKLNPFTTAWLATKLVLLLLYIALGVVAMRRERSGCWPTSVRCWCSASCTRWRGRISPWVCLRGCSAEVPAMALTWTRLQLFGSARDADASHEHRSARRA